MAKTGGRLADIVAELAPLYPQPPLLTDPLAQILWENIGYLIDDARRATLFADFATRIGISADAIDRADAAVLLEIAARGGMRPAERVERWRSIARIVLDHGGDLDAALRALPLSKARKLLQAFPMIGGPSADRILLVMGLSLTPSLESNGLRVLQRLGVAPEQANYVASYRAAIEALGREGPADREVLIAAQGLLRDHGKTLCRRTEPNCLACPLDAACAHVVLTNP